MRSTDQGTVPKFRKGVRPHLITLRYRRIDFDRADLAFRSLVRFLSERPHLDNHIIGSRNIRDAMKWSDTEKVSKGSATTYRRVWDALGLGLDVPGLWNPDSLSHSGGNTKFFTDFSDYNQPAEFCMNAVDLDDFARVVDGHDIYTLSRGYQPGNNTSAIAFGNSRPSHVYFVEKPRSGEVLSSALTYYSYRHILARPTDKTDSDHEKHSILIEVEPPTASVVLVREGSASVWTHRRRRSAECCFLINNRPLKVEEIVQMTGYPQAKVYRLIRRGQAQKVGYGHYWCSCHTMSEFVIESVESREEKSLVSVRSHGLLTEVNARSEHMA